MIGVVLDGVQEECVVADRVGVGGIGVDGSLVHLFGLIHIATNVLQKLGVGSESVGVSGIDVDGLLVHVLGLIGVVSDGV